MLTKKTYQVLDDLTEKQCATLTNLQLTKASMRFEMLENHYNGKNNINLVHIEKCQVFDPCIKHIIDR